eukprot:NODE_281_length_1051_cov_654.118762_g239_i0.p1 GENE.NODE_281_length_1051_cov_654.118762_g239_i0~~NODE_281_length_1051_cov_654.118762_g239_i0.p1  ORF type:complete len:294 (+),score=89.04 NODE_281_length_1051_cov_654.118762_g239_i0:77-958(+)
MPFVKVVKNRAYFKRFQTKYRRRRQGKTDFLARKRLVNQEKNKYNAPRYRFIDRMTNKDVICQVAYSEILGDRVMAAAYSHELSGFGAKVGLTNHAACYATGLLCARRILTKVGLADKYEGCTDVSGADFNVEEIEGPRPFKALLDVGLARTSTGARVFGALKGALDGGINIPHSVRRFPGFDKGKDELDNEKHRQRIYGLHVAQYQKVLQKDDPEKYNTTFARYVKEGVAPDKLESMWKSVHSNIRKNPVFKKKVPKGGKPKSYSVPKRGTANKLHRQHQKKLAANRKRLEA